MTWRALKQILTDRSTMPVRRPRNPQQGATTAPPPRRRGLVLTSESAGHRFRQTLPPHVLRPLPDMRGRNDGDVKLFVMSFAAFFVAAFTFVA